MVTETTDSLAVHLSAAPHGPLSREHLALVQVQLPRPSPGTVLVRNLCTAIDPHPSPLITSRWRTHSALRVGPMLGQVIRSRSADLPPGTLITHRDGWATHSVLPRGGYLTRVVAPPPGVPAAEYLSMLGTPGREAYLGLIEILKIQPGESVYIGEAADPVGRAAARLARLAGARRVIGGVSSPQAARIAARDAAFDCILGNPALPGLQVPGVGGIDCALVTAGQPYLAEAVGLMRDYGRVAWLYRRSPAQDASATVDLSAVPERGIRIEGFAAHYHAGLYKQIETRLTRKLASGRLQPGLIVDTEFSRLPDHLTEAARTGAQVADVFSFAPALSPDTAMA